MTSRVAGYPVGNPMPERRKVFRIEKMAAAHVDAPSSGNSVCSCCEEVMRELAALRAMLAAAPSRPFGTSVAESAEVRSLASRLRDIRTALIGAERAGPDGTTAANAPMSRFAHELDAAVKASEQATQKILAAAEEIDQAANNLSAAVKGNTEQGLAQDIRDRSHRDFRSVQLPGCDQPAAGEGQNGTGGTGEPDRRRPRRSYE